MGTVRGHKEGEGEAGDGCLGERGWRERAREGGDGGQGPLEKAGGGNVGQREEMKKPG